MTAVTLAKRIARDVAKEAGCASDAEYGPKVRGKLASYEHGYMPGALATVAYEGFDMVPLTLSGKYSVEGFWVEAYSSWLIGIYKD